MSLGISGSNVNPSDIPENSNFEVHFIDVGQADSALIECDGKTMMIDGGNVADSNVVAAYLKKEDVTELNYVVCSHAHEDHVGGLSGALSVTKADNIYAPKTEANTKAYKNFKKKAKVLFNFSDIHTIGQLVNSNVGITLMTDFLPFADMDSLIKIPLIPEDKQIFHVQYAYLRSTLLNADLKELIRLLDELNEKIN